MLIDKDFMFTCSDKPMATRVAEKLMEAYYYCPICEQEWFLDKGSKHCPCCLAYLEEVDEESWLVKEQAE